MMDSILEQQRNAHEAVERMEQAIVEEYLTEPKTFKDRMVHDHHVNEYLNMMQQRTRELVETYEDKDGRRAAEIAALSGSDEFGEFYQRLRAIKDSHRRNPNQSVEVVELELRDRNREAEAAALDNLFSGEEGGGRFIDLLQLHEQYLNLKGIKRVSYLVYLDQFHRFETIPRNVKNANYHKYLKDLSSYFENFFQRTRPLMNLDELREEAKSEFEDRWKAGTFPGWENEQADREGAEGEDSTEESLFCIACKKQFAKQTVFNAHLKGRKHIKAAEALLRQGTTGTGESQASNDLKESRQRYMAEQDQRRREVAFQEALVQKFAEILETQREATRANIERKQALTDQERQMELEQEQDNVGAASGSDDDEEEERIYNPLNLPLGWDGKPIPYWLYKLHGLGVEYPCEICGNFVYMGRKAFERHFQEWRHAHGMRCLGIPNTKHFHEITGIEDAYALWEKIRSEKTSEVQREDNVEEYEDTQGNVFNRKTYEDLRRQGLL